MNASETSYQESRQQETRQESNQESSHQENSQESTGEEGAGEKSRNQEENGRQEAVKATREDRFAGGCRREAQKGGQAPPGSLRGLLTDALDERLEIFGVLLLLRQDVFHETSAGGILLAKVTDHLRVGFDGDALGHEILADHIH